MLGWLINLRDLMRAMVRQGVALRLPQTAASLAFLSLLALVPVISIAFAVLAALPVFAQLREALQQFISTNLFLPGFAAAVISRVNEFAQRASELSTVGALIFLATAISALQTIDRALNAIWLSDRPRTIARRLTLYWTLLTLGPLILAASLLVNGMVVGDWLAGLPNRSVERAWVSTVPLLLGLGGLTLMYRLLPNAPVRWLEAVMGALLAVMILHGLNRVFGLYVARLPTYAVVYGAFSALPLFLLWLLLLWLTVLVGALFAANLRHWGRGDAIHVDWTPAERFEAGARVLRELAHAHRTGGGLVPVERLRGVLGADPLRAESLARLLSRLGYLTRHWQLPASGRGFDAERAVWDESWALADVPERLTLRRLFDAVWQGRVGSRERRKQENPKDSPSRLEVPLADRPL